MNPSILQYSKMFIEQSQPTQSEPYSSNLSNHIPKQRQLTSKPTITYSQVYPSLLIISNNSRQFICEQSIPPKCKTIKINDPRIHAFYAAISKLFVEIADCFNIKDLWVCEKEVTMYPISTYFTGPAKYPGMECCRKAVYVKFQYDLSGSVRCSKCHKIAFSFVNVPKQPIKPNKGKQNIPINEQKKSIHNKHKYGSIHKQNNYMNEKLSNIRTQNNQLNEILKQYKRQKQNERIYKQKKMTEENRKTNIRKLISSNQHRYKSLKKALKLNECNIVDLRSSMGGEYDDSKMKSNIGNKITSLLPVNIGQFIIQIQNQPGGGSSNADNFNIFQQQIKKGNSINSSSKIILQKQNKFYPQIISDSSSKQKYNQLVEISDLSQTCQEIKSIIQQIFA